MTKEITTIVQRPGVVRAMADELGMTSKTAGGHEIDPAFIVLKPPKSRKARRRLWDKLSAVKNRKKLLFGSNLTSNLLILSSN
jgi:hypothetical protein